MKITVLLVCLALLVSGCGQIVEQNDHIEETPVKHEQDFEAMSDFLSEADDNTDTETREEAVVAEEPDLRDQIFELMDYLDEPTALISLLGAESAGTGYSATGKVMLHFGVEGIEDDYFSLYNEGDDNVRFLGIRIGDTEAEVREKLSVIPYEEENAAVDMSPYYLIWNDEAKNPFVSIEFVFDVETMAGIGGDETEKPIMQSKGATLKSWTLTNYFKSVSDVNPYYLSLSSNYADFLSDIMEYIYAEYDCDINRLEYYGEVELGGEAGIAFFVRDENGEYCDYFYWYNNFSKTVSVIDRNRILGE